MLTALVILAVLGILFGAGVLATYDGEVLRDPHPDDRDAVLPPGAVQPEDVQELRFDLALRGYRMAEVDGAMERLAEELAARDSRIAELERALVELSTPPVAYADEVRADAEPSPEEPAVASAEVATAAAELEPTSPQEEEVPAAPEAFEPLEPPSVAPAAISGPLTATTWFTEPAPVAAPDDVPVDLASAQVDTPVEEPERTQQEEPQQEEPQQEPHAEEPALTLPAADEAFSFPELQPPDPAADPEEARPEV